MTLTDLWDNARFYEPQILVTQVFLPNRSAISWFVLWWKDGLQNFYLDEFRKGAFLGSYFILGYMSQSTDVDNMDIFQWKSPLRNAYISGIIVSCVHKDGVKLM